MDNGKEKKVLFIATVQSHIMNFHIPYIEYFQKKGYKVYVACKLDKNKYNNMDIINREIIWENIDFDRSPFSKNTIRATKQLKQLMNDKKFDLVHVHTPVGSILGRVAAKLTKTAPIIYTAHGFHFFKGASLKNWILYYGIEKIIAPLTDAIITMNEEDFNLAKTKLKSRIRENIFKVNGVGIDIEKYNISNKKDMEFKKSLNLNEEDFVITVVAELIERKNHKQIIDAMKLIANQQSDIKILFVGDGVLHKEIEQQVKTNSLENNISLLGFRKDVEKILNISDAIGLFSHHEGLPKNIMEGMVAGKPIICTRIRGNVDLVEDGVNGILVDFNDIEETENAILKLYYNRDLAHQMGANNQESIKEYDIEKVILQMDEIYTKLLNK